MTQQNAVYEHMQVKRMLHYVKVWFFPFKWGVNTYRGCEHNCLYCNARYTNEYLGLPTGAFAHKILVKDNAAEVLDKEFRELPGKATSRLTFPPSPIRTNPQRTASKSLEGYWKYF